MRSTRRSQGGASLVEAVVASALMGIGVVAGLTAWDTAAMSAEKAVRQAWATCVARAELDAVLAAPYADTYTPKAPFVSVVASRVRGSADSLDEEQSVTVSAYDQSGVLGQATSLKARALGGGKVYDDVGNDVWMGCPAR
jgi:Tfp pilus assembly protein PilV